LEQRGVVRVFPDDPGATDAPVFLDIRDRVNDGGNEEGLLGLAFHPEFAANGRFFVDYTASNPRRTVIAELRVDGGDPVRADPASEAVILDVGQPYANHNGGQIAFGPDGFLYIALGDGGSGGDPQGNGQNRGSLLGSILRIDVDAPALGRAYGIPPDNPFVGNDRGYREEIFAYGLRNPWRFSFDPETGELWAGDVGQNRIEEIDLVRRGENYGWNIMEGSSCYEPSSGCDRTGLSLPVAEYSHDLGISVTGGYVYRGAAVPGLEGQYLYADFGSGRIWALSAGTPEDAQAGEILRTNLSIASFGVDAAGEVLLCAFDGKIYRLVGGS
jgi:glucose/arabinose dehydrogenase